MKQASTPAGRRSPRLPSAEARSPHAGPRIALILSALQVWALCAAAPVVAADLPAPPATTAVPAAKASGPALVPASGGSVATVWAVGDELWDRPRSAEVIRTQPAVRQAVGALLATAGSSLVIRHGRGQNDELRAEELRHWLVALAVEPQRIRVSVVPAGAAIEGHPRGTLLLELAR